MLQLCPEPQIGQKVHSLSRMWAVASQEGGRGAILEGASLI